MPMKFECKCGKIHYFKLDMPVIDKIEYEEAEKELITVLKKYNNQPDIMKYTIVKILTPQYKKIFDNFLKENIDTRSGMFGYTGLKPRGNNEYVTSESITKIMRELSSNTDQLISSTIQTGTFGLVNSNGKPHKHIQNIGMGGGIGEVSYNATIASFDNLEHEQLNK